MDIEQRVEAQGQVKVYREGSVARVVIENEARRNALTLEMKRQFLHAFAELEGDTGVRCVILTGAGIKSFISGADISEFDKARADPTSEAKYIELAKSVTLAPVKTSKPTIARIRGACAGGGLQLAVACDVRIASEDAFFIMPAAKLGIGYPYVGMSLFMSLLGRARVADLFLSGRRVSAAEALEIGLVDFVVANDFLDGFVADYADKVSSNAPLSLALIKRSIHEIAGTESGSPSAEIDALMEACANSVDAIEGRRAFAEKRKANFQGR
ncbi:short chain enoyl-CoA hydratase [Caballeronia calidae]|uniref:Short chain enoyl-CoA hydratase n=1 Tax=Caballeronia calidae TaxID=1777139 RepID=A0A158EFJ3_9BURK|nr:enoyl-CoA hydratase-related protein [Caballeronia calidae]SAL05618.1 short chain enoyl-CoA hydratase [Caballeronia calidae]